VAADPLIAIAADTAPGNDRVAMQYLIPGWSFDHKRPCLMR
jgi:hypothetical protein